MENEEIEIGKMMEAYSIKGGLERFKLRKSRSKYVGQTRVANSGSEYTVLGNLDKRDVRGVNSYFLIGFEDTTRLVVNASNIGQGEIKNPNTPCRVGVGFKGQGKYCYRSHTKEYATWHNMLARCYDEISLENHPAYKGCSVDKRWYNFQNFCEDLPSLENYGDWKENTKSHAYALDKDIKIEGNKIYSKDTCMFITIAENTAMANKGRARSLTGKTYLATFLETGYEEEFKNQRKFARDNSLSPRCIWGCIKEELKQHKGWTFKTLD